MAKKKQKTNYSSEKIVAIALINYDNMDCLKSDDICTHTMGRTSYICIYTYKYVFMCHVINKDINNIAINNVVAMLAE